MNKILEEALLYDFYGELLTERRRNIYEAVRFGDLSLAEAAEEYGISRQGIHDILHRADEALHEYEAKLGLVERFMETRRAGERILALCRGFRETRDDAILTQIEELARHLKEEENTQ